MSAENPRAEAVVDLAAIRANVALLRTAVAPAQLMVVVKADGYGHGMVPVARAARAAGAEWLGVAVLEEAMLLRAAGDTGRILAWLAAPGEAYDTAIESGVELTASSLWQLDDIMAAACRVGRAAQLQLKVDTGLSRNGASASDWPAVVVAARAAESAGTARVTGIWSHLACADDPGHPSLQRQEDAFHDALSVASRAGVRPAVRHLANSAAALTRPSAHFELVRCGLAAYGLSPVPQQRSAADLGLRPAMTLRGRLALTKSVPAGSGVSYGHHHVTAKPTTLGLVPLGYAEGVPRHASNRGRVWAGGRQHRVVGDVCMDQVVVDLEDTPVAAGDEVVVFGPGDRGEPTAQDWAEAAGTISYEIVTRLGPRVVRRHIEDTA